jgi:ATP-dependent protease Clp ATPase subunit
VEKKRTYTRGVGKLRIVDESFVRNPPKKIHKDDQNVFVTKSELLFFCVGALTTLGVVAVFALYSAFKYNTLL